MSEIELSRTPVLQDPLVVARIGGEALRSIGARHEMTGEGVRVYVQRQLRETLKQIELDCYLGAKLEDMGCAADWPTFLIPPGPERTLAIGLVDWLVAELHRRGVDVTVKATPTRDGGLAMQIRYEFPADNDGDDSR